jgi:hypothetical protein
VRFPANNASIASHASSSHFSVAGLEEFAASPDIDGEGTEARAARQRRFHEARVVGLDSVVDGSLDLAIG